MRRPRLLAPAPLAGLATILLALAACGDRGTPKLDVRIATPTPIPSPADAAAPAPTPPALEAAPTLPVPAAAVAAGPETAPAGAPRVVALDPPSGATDVDPARDSIAATFDRVMDPGGWAWVVEGPETAPETGEARWEDGGRTSRVQVRLEAGRSYVVWINSPQFSYFRDPSGVAATPLRWTFSTRGAPATAGPAPIALLRGSQPSGPPRVVRLAPADGAVDVDPATAELRATFDRPMAEGWSWVTEGPETFPETTGRAFLTSDGTQAVLPVRLEPGRTYVIWLNSEEFRNFHDRDGRELAPVRWTFATRPGGP
ncbi:MAG: Ig-like domain-containing protein [Thermoanaerobaculia bacterium]|nr:Ig-like domain-containing protein [Thermoanaerobaculia bacterium]